MKRWGGSDSQWERIGQSDPLWGVLSSEEFRSANLTPEAEARFWASGEEYVTHALDLAERTVGPVDLHGTAVDFGCGVGRLLLPLARRFDRAVGIDVAPSMRALALERSQQESLDNVEVVETPAGLAGATLVHSALAFQHVPVKRGEELFAQLVDALAPGGVGYVHLPIDRYGQRLRGFVRDLQARAPAIRPVLNVLRRQPAGAPHMQMNIYDVGRLVGILFKRGVTTVQIHDVFTDGEFVLGSLVFRVPTR